MKLSIIKTYLPYFQFSAVVITIVMGLHTGLERFIKKDPNPIEFNVHSFSIQSVNKAGHETHRSVKFTYKKMRDDCTWMSQDLSVEDHLGFRHEAVGTKLKHIDEDRKDNIQHAEFHFIAPVHVKGVVKLTGNNVFKCREGDIVVEFPEVKGLQFNNGK